MKTLNEAAVMAALEQSNGSITLAAIEFDMPRADLWDFILLRPPLVRALNDRREQWVDNAEQALNEALEAGQKWAICFILQTIGKKRGYGKRGGRTEPERPRAEDPKPDMTRFTPAKLDEYEHIKNIARGSPDGSPIPEPEFVLKLDKVGREGEPVGVGVQRIIVESSGNIGHAAKRLGVTREELLEYLLRRPDIGTPESDRREAAIDKAEQELCKAVDNRKPWAIKFTLKTLGRSRGYTERLDEPETPVKLPADFPTFARLNNEQFARLLQLSHIAYGDERTSPPQPAADQPVDEAGLRAELAAAPVGPTVGPAVGGRKPTVDSVHVASVAGGVVPGPTTECDRPHERGRPGLPDEPGRPEPNRQPEPSRTGPGNATGPPTWRHPDDW